MHLYLTDSGVRIKVRYRKRKIQIENVSRINIVPRHFSTQNVLKNFHI